LSTAAALNIVYHGKDGEEPEFVHGQRVTDQETMDIVEMVLGGL